MRELGFREIQTMECLLREYNVQTTSMPVADLGFGNFGETTPGYGPVNNTRGGIREPQVGMVQKASKSWRRKRTYQRYIGSKEDIVKKQSKQEVQSDVEDESGDDQELSEEEAKNETNIESQNISESNYSEEKSTKDDSAKIDTKDNGTYERYVYVCKSAAPKLVIPGHTGYLTFATLFPEFTTQNDM